MKRIVELINPSDAITFLMDDVKVAGTAIIILGRGKYGLEDENGTVVPLMLFGGFDEWLKEVGIENFSQFVYDHRDACAEFLETVHYGKTADRQSFDEAIALMTPENAAKYRKQHNDRRRSSLNNIEQGCFLVAKQMRAMEAPNQIAKLPSQQPIILTGPA